MKNGTIPWNGMLAQQKGTLGWIASAYIQPSVPRLSQTSGLQLSHSFYLQQTAVIPPHGECHMQGSIPADIFSYYRYRRLLGFFPEDLFFLPARLQNAAVQIFRIDIMNSISRLIQRDLIAAPGQPFQ